MIAVRTTVLAVLALASASPVPAQGRGDATREPYVERIPGTVVTFEMIPVPGGTVHVETPEGRRRVEVPPLWVSRTEVTWDLYEIFVFGLDQPADAAGADAVSRPSRPYALPGDHFGHRGHPAIGMSLHAAREFTRWLSQKTGRAYRLATEAEWVHACLLGRSETSDDGVLAERAWIARNAGDRTHPAASLPPNALGVHDMLGNVAEWVVASDDTVAMGGAFDSEAEAVSCTARRRQTSAWNASDPQLPKSRWWLPDAVFVGIRLVREESR